MQKTIIQILKNIESQKREKKKIPTTPLLKEVRYRLQETLLAELANMERSGILEIGRTVNDEYIKLK